MAERRKTPQGKGTAKAQSVSRRFTSRGVDVQINEAPGQVELSLDGMPISVSLVDGEYHSQLANQFVGFSSVEELVETLLANEGKTWTLHGGGQTAPGHGHGHEHGHEMGHEHRPGGGS